MSAVSEFFERLLLVHLFFWDSKFRRFDALVLFASVNTALGVTDYLVSEKFDGVSLSIILQFLVYMGAFLFCFLWRPFRGRLTEIAGNMVCLSLCISVLAALMAIALVFMTSVPPLDETVGVIVNRGIGAIRYYFNFDSRYILTAILFLLAYACVFLNTIHIYGRRTVSIASRNIIPLVFSGIISLAACGLVLWPILVGLG